MMAINYVVQADLVDIRDDTPQPTDNFLVDTNVWLWLTYTKASPVASTPPQANHYPKYLQKCLAAHATLCWCGLSLAELSHLIEKTEREIFIAANAKVGTKEFRHNFPAERATVVSEVQTAWAQVKMLGVPLVLSVDGTTTDAALARHATQPLDGYDLFILEAMSRGGLAQVVTDDGDFSAVPGIRLFTANANLIQAASAQGRLRKR